MEQQITSRGQALEEGLEVFISVPILSSEYLSFNDSFNTLTLSSPLIAITLVGNYAVSAVSSVQLPTFSNTDWYRFSSNALTPSSVENSIVIPVSEGGGVSSVSGIFQELKRLIVGNEYTITINFHNTASVGTMGISRLYNSKFIPYALMQSSVTNFSLPLSQITLDFKAETNSDILFIDFTSTETSSTSISSISVKGKDSYNLPVLMNLEGYGISQVLRRKYGISPIEEGEE